jgi:hypothetical protein
MSHDRGCPCGKEGEDEYATCTDITCFRQPCVSTGKKYRLCSPYATQIDVCYSVILYYAHRDIIEDWCLSNGAIWNGMKQIHTTSMVLRGNYIDFYDEEMYTLFKMKWG